uniref:Uncharacterized protein n=1 Tax=Rhizophora mucronata TaxID=61149 RepID=A0A2P2P4S7_RHIMU
MKQTSTLSTRRLAFSFFLFSHESIAAINSSYLRSHLSVEE